jgi:hypothetical protein
MIVSGPEWLSRKKDLLGFDGTGIESPLGARFSTPVHNGPGAHSASYTMGTSASSGGKAAGAWG